MDGISTCYISRSELKAQKSFLTYDALQEKYEINRWFLWKIINDESYQPPVWIQRRLGWVVRKPQPFRPCLPKVTDEQRAKILAMTPEERLEKLLR